VKYTTLLETEGKVVYERCGNAKVFRQVKQVGCQGAVTGVNPETPSAATEPTPEVTAPESTIANVNPATHLSVTICTPVTIESQSTGDV
jgi:hypothetical protein